MTIRSGQWHWDRFAEFARAKSAIGEPTPHMNIVVALSKTASKDEKWWRAGCYAAGYSVLTAEALWREWPWPRVLNEPPGALLNWLEANWAGIHTRKDRRCVRTPTKFARCLLSYADWVGTASVLLDPNSSYDVWWEEAERIDFMGRYILIRLLELYRRWGFMAAELYDIRSVGAWSPIRCLCLLRPTELDALMTGDRKVVDRVALEVLESLRLEPNLANMTAFRYAALLCEYRSCWEKGRDYPGNQIDEELEYAHSKYARHWQERGFTSDLITARRTLFPHESLGELNGWEGRRLEVAALLSNQGLVWSDLLYDYSKFRISGEVVGREARTA